MPTPLDYFQMEAAERLERLSSGLIALERSTGDEALARDLFREVHSLKGAAGVSGLTDISDICHKMEDLLGGIKEGTDQVSAAVINALLSATDAVQELVAARVTGRSCAVSKAAVLKRLDMPCGTPPSAKNGASSDLPRSVPAMDDSPGTPGLGSDRDGHATPDRGSVHDAASAHEARPTAHEKHSSERADDEARAVPAMPAAMETVRLRVETLESLANLTGELMVVGDGLRQRLDAVKDLYKLACDTSNRHGDIRTTEESLRDIAAAARKLIDDFTSDVTILDPLIAEIHEQVLTTRMLPISMLFDKLERFVRDCCSQEHKQAELYIEGAGIQVDRHVLEQLRDPMIHLIRNALSHGIEPPDERKRLGKEPVGAVRVAVSRHGDRIRIACEDDGGGIDHRRVLAKAVSAGLIPPAETEGLSTRQIYDLLLRPGFSTADFVTDLSGRGVGLDVVAQRLEALRGTLQIESELGKFTRMTMEFPASVATLEGLLIETAGFTYVVPTTSVACTARISLAEVRTIGGEAIARVDEQAVPLLMLDHLLGRAERTRTPRNFVSAVVVHHGPGRIAVGVDRLLGTRTIVAKSLGDRAHKLRGVMGATILGTGLPALILDLGRLAQDRPVGTAHDGELVAASAVAVEPTCVLIVDDSITTRMMEKSILESAGYRVHCAIHAEDALARVEHSVYDLFVVDVEMPGMNGFELTRKLRQDDRFAGTPVIIVTSLASDESRREGLDAGANAYITKGQFDQHNLLQTVERLVGK